MNPPGAFPKPVFAVVITALLCAFPRVVHAQAKPTITTQPLSQSVLAGSNASFSVIASGQTPFSYQWSFNGTNLTNGLHINGANNSTLIVSNVVASDMGDYQVIVGNSHGSATSSNAMLTVLFSPHSRSNAMLTVLFPPHI